MTDSGVLFITEHLRDIVREEVDEKLDKKWSLRVPSSFRTNIMKQLPEKAKIPIVDYRTREIELGEIHLEIEHFINQFCYSGKFIDARIKDYSIKIFEEPKEPQKPT